MLVVNCGVVGGYLTLTAGPTPFSGDQWLLTEVVTVPVVEETMWAERSSRPCSPRSGAAARDARRPRRPCGRAASPSASMVLHAAMNLTVVLV